MEKGRRRSQGQEFEQQRSMFLTLLQCWKCLRRTVGCGVLAIVAGRQRLVVLKLELAMVRDDNRWQPSTESRMSKEGRSSRDQAVVCRRKLWEGHRETQPTSKSRI